MVQAEEDWSVIEAKLKRLREKLLHCQTERILVNLTGDETTLEIATSENSPNNADPREGGLSLKQCMQRMQEASSFSSPPSSSSPSPSGSNSRGAVEEEQARHGSQEDKPEVDERKETQNDAVTTKPPQPCAWALKLKEEISFPASDLATENGEEKEKKEAADHVDAHADQRPEDLPEGFVIPTQVGTEEAPCRILESLKRNRLLCSLASKLARVWKVATRPGSSRLNSVERRFFLFPLVFIVFCPSAQTQVRVLVHTFRLSSFPPVLTPPLLSLCPGKAPSSALPKWSLPVRESVSSHSYTRICIYV